MQRGKWTLATGIRLVISISYRLLAPEALEARRLVELRERWLNPPEWVEWVDERFSGYPVRLVAPDVACRAKCRFPR